MFTTIAYQCLNRDFKKRPLMTEVVEMLERALAYQVMQPNEVRSRILKYLNKIAFRFGSRLLNDQGQPNINFLERLFQIIDETKDERLSRSELKALFIGMRLDEINMEVDDLVDLVMKDFDTSQNNEIDRREFVSGIVKWLDEDKGSK